MNRCELAVQHRGRAILKRVAATARGAEVGALRGRLSKFLLANAPQLQLIMVDRWVSDESIDSGRLPDRTRKLVVSEWRECFHQAKWLTEFAADRREMLNGDSRRAAKRVPNDSLDFVFLDADPSATGVRSDIKVWFPKLVPGGWIGGHKIDHPSHPQWGVRQAASELAQTIGQPLLFDADFTWFVYKPRTTPTIPNSWSLLGPKMWAELHDWALKADLSTVDPWLNRFAERIPCGDCRHHWLQLLQTSPPDVRSANALFEWTVLVHNEVNRRLQKPHYSLDDAKQLWSQQAPMLSLSLSPIQTITVRQESRVAGAAAFAVSASAVHCAHAAPTARAHFVSCKLKLYGGTPHIAICESCPSRKPFNGEQLPKPDTSQPTELPAPVQQNLAQSGSAISVHHGPDTSQKLVLRSFLSPGDIVMLTAAVRDLHRAHPGRFKTAVQTTAMELWDHNPYISTQADDDDSWQVMNMHYPLINQSNQRRCILCTDMPSS